MIHVCYSLYDNDGRYSKFTATSIVSMFENTRAEITVHILTDSTLTEINREKFLALAEKYGQKIFFYDVEKICAEEINLWRQLMPKVAKRHQAILYRLWLPKIIDVDIKKIIYLDSDTIVNLDIAELWQIELGDKALAAVSEAAQGTGVTNRFSICRDGFVKAENYFNSGVLLINVEKFDAAQKNFVDAMKFAVEHKYFYVDQDVLNYCFDGQTLKLPPKFNRFVLYARYEKDFETREKILHFAGGSLNLNLDDVFNRLWFEYFKKTNRFNLDDFIKNLYSVVDEIYFDEKKSAANVSAIVADKKRVFFLDAELLEHLLIALSVMDGEEVIVANSKQSVKILAREMLKSRGSKIFFIAVYFYKEVREVLTKAGFVENVDFLDAMKFLPMENFVAEKLLKAL